MNFFLFTLHNLFLILSLFVKLCEFSYIEQLCEDTGCSPEDLPDAMNDREEWR